MPVGSSLFCSLFYTINKLTSVQTVHVRGTAAETERKKAEGM